MDLMNKIDKNGKDVLDNNNNHVNNVINTEFEEQQIKKN